MADIDISDILAGKTPGIIPSALQTKARKILRAAARAKPTVAMASGNPTVTIGAVGVASTLTTGYGNSGAAAAGGQSHPGNTPLMTDLGPPWSVSLQASGGYMPLHVFGNLGVSQNNYRTGQHGAGRGFFFDGQTFDVCVDVNTRTIRLAITDLATGIRQWGQAADYVPSSGGVSYVKFDLGSRADRLIEIYFGGTASAPRVFGYDFFKTDTVRPAQYPDAPRGLIFGDSYVNGLNFADSKSRFAEVLGEMIGIRDPIVNGVSGTGYVARATTSKTYGERITAGDLDVATVGELDIVLMLGSINDNVGATEGAIDATVQAAAQAAITDALTRQPNAIFMIAGPQFAKNFQTPTLRYTAMQNAVIAAAAGDPRVIWIDSSPAGDGWQTGTGSTSVNTGDGSNDFFGATDGVHLNSAGNPNMGRRAANSVLARLKALAA